MLNKKIKLSLISDYRSSIMGVGALLIVIFHLWLSLFAKIEYVSTIERVIKNICYCGVDIFFLVSGLGLYYSLKKNNDVKQFYKRRFPKFILGFLIASVLVSLFTLNLDSASNQQFSKEALGLIKTLRNWVFTWTFLCIGLNTEFRKIIAVGYKPLVAFTLGVAVNLPLGYLLSAYLFEDFWTNFMR